MAYDNWRKRLEIAGKYSTVPERRAAVAALKINFSQPGPEDEGYYRKPITKKLPNGHNEIIGWVPVAYFNLSANHEATLHGVIGSGDEQREMTVREINDEELWSYVVSNPISYEVYEAVADKGGAWSDLAEPARLSKEPPFHRVIERTDNLPPTVDPLTEHKEAIENATKAALANHNMVIASDEHAARAEGAKNRIAELRLAADKAGKAIYEPIYREYQAVQKAWTPMVKLAADAEATLKTRILTWREKERRRLASEAAEAELAQRMKDAAAERAADRAIANGVPPAEQTAPVAAPEPVAAPPPPPPTYGKRVTKAAESWHYDGVTDWPKVIEFYKDSSELKALLTHLAQRDVKQGREVPGTNRHWGIV